MKSALFTLIGFIAYWGIPALAQPQTDPTSYIHYSPEADLYRAPCMDTVKQMGIKAYVNVALVFPAWLPVVDYDHVAVIEGKVVPKPGTVQKGTTVSAQDASINHYTHDFYFNVAPDTTEDRRYLNLIGGQVDTVMEDGVRKMDTFFKPYVHIEWETGLAATNKGNLCAELNKQGKSCGFFTAGHERHDRIWNWPTFDDWVHVEGLWVWDRGHPPAYTEIHPARLVATRRNLPARIPKIQGEKNGEKVFATRIDIFASGDCGAYNNNRKTSPEFVRKVKMSSKDYTFQVKHTLPRPSPLAKMKMRVETHKGNTHHGQLSLIPMPDGNGEADDPMVTVFIPWKTFADTLVCAKTVYVYWDEGDGKALDYKIESYKVTLESLRFKRINETFSPAEMRIFAGTASDYIFINEFTKHDRFLMRGLGQNYTLKRKWYFDYSWEVHVPEDREYRIHASGWEEDGVSTSLGQLRDPYSPCTKEVREELQKTIIKVMPLRFQGCVDDQMGEIHQMHKLGDSGEFEAISDGELSWDICPFNKGLQLESFKMYYRIEPLSD